MMNKMKTIEFCKENKIPYVLMRIKKVLLPEPIVKHGITLTHGKEYSEIPTGWKELGYDELNEKYNNERDLNPKYNGVAVNLNKGNLVVVDLDGANAKDLLKEYGDEWKSKSCLRRLPHLWFKKHPDDKNTTDINHKEGIDLLYHIVIELKVQNIHNCGNELRTYNDFPKVEKKVKFKIKSKNNNIIKDIDMDVEPTNPTREQTDIINNIAVKYLDNYGDWLKIMWGLYNTFHNIELCDTVSKKSSKYTCKNDVIKYIASDKQNVISFGTISHYSKLSDPERHEDIFFEYHIEDIMSFGDKSLADAYINLKNDNLIKDNGTIYTYKQPYWKVEENLIKDISIQLTNVITKKFIQVCKELSKLEIDLFKANSKEDKEKIELKIKLLLIDKKGLLKVKGKIESYTKLTSVKKFVETFLEEKDYKMNQLKPNYFCFSNKAFDMDTREEVQVKKSDYISNHTGYPYKEPKQKQIDTITTLLEQIFPDEENRKCLLSILRAGCIGKQNPYFVLFNGDGSNGKGLLLEMVDKVIGNYFCISNKQFLLEPIKTGANTALMNLHEKRMVVFSEPEEGQQLYQDTIKLITDNPVLSGRGNYELKERRVLLQCITILECNARPSIRGRKDNAILRRIIDLHFTQTFTDDKDLLELDNHHQINRKYKTLPFQEEHRHAFFNVLLNSTENDVYIPSKVKSRGLDYLMGSDELLMWVNNHYDKTDNKQDLVKVKDMYDLLKMTPFYSSLTSKQRLHEWNANSFKSKISTNIQLKLFYKDRIRIDGKDYRSVLKGYKLKTENN